MTDIHDIPATLLDADFSDEELVDDAVNAFSPKPVVSRENSIEDTVNLNLKEHEITPAPPVMGAEPTPTLDSAASKKRSWRKPEDKPKRPLSAYNLFFQLERQRLISDSRDSAPYTAEDVASVSRAHKMKKEKRRHRKTHGKISFADLARTIAQKWKLLEASDKVVFEERAEIEKARYKEDLEEWNIKQQQSFNQRKANMLRKVSLEPNPGMGRHLDKSSAMGMGMQNSYGNPLSHARASYDLGGIYSNNHEAALQEEANLQQSLMHRQSLARYQALMEQQLDQASLDQMVMGYNGTSGGGSSMGNISSRRPYLGEGGSSSSALGGGGYGGGFSNYYEDEYDYNELAQAYSNAGPSLGGRNSNSQVGGLGRMQGNLGDNHPGSTPRPAPTSEQQYYSNTMDRSTSSHHSEHTQHPRAGIHSAYRQQTSIPHSAPAPVEDTLQLDPHQDLWGGGP